MIARFSERLLFIESRHREIRFGKLCTNLLIMQISGTRECASLRVHEYTNATSLRSQAASVRACVYTSATSLHSQRASVLSVRVRECD